MRYLRRVRQRTASSAFGKSSGVWLVGAGVNYIPLVLYAHAGCRWSVHEGEVAGLESETEPFADDTRPQLAC